MALMIDGNHLTIEDVIQVARHGEKVELTEEAKAKVNKARAYVDQKLEDGRCDLRPDHRFRQIQRCTHLR